VRRTPQKLFYQVTLVIMFVISIALVYSGAGQLLHA
jgi:hypothetical protein